MSRFNPYKQNQLVNYATNLDVGLRKWRTTLAKVNAGVQSGFAEVAVIGDSISEGANVSYSSVTDYITKSYVGRMRSVLGGKFGDVGYGFLGTHFPWCSTTGQTNRGNYQIWSYAGTGWADSSFGLIVGKSTATNGDTATISITGTGVGIVVFTGTGAGAFNVTVDGGTPTAFTANTAGGAVCSAFEVTGLTAGTHSVVVKNTDTGGKNLFLVGAYPINGSSGVRVHNFSRGGALAGDHNQANSTLNLMDWLKPALTIISLSANDYHNQISLSTYQTNLQALINKAQQYGDVLLTTIGAWAVNLTIPQSAYWQTIMSLALQNNCGYLDTSQTRWGGAAYANATLGLIQDNQVHPNDQGHYDLSNALVNVLLETR